MTEHIEFRDGDEILTLWVEKRISVDELDYVVGWCPERQNNIFVHPENIIEVGGNNDEAAA